MDYNLGNDTENFRISKQDKLIAKSLETLQLGNMGDFTDRKILDDMFINEMNIVCRFIEEEPANATPTLHSHTFYEIIVVTGGNILYSINNQRYHVQRGDIILLPPGTLHKPLFDDPVYTTSGYSRMVLMINSRFWNALVKSDAQLNYCFNYCLLKNQNVFRVPLTQSKQLFDLIPLLSHELFEDSFCWKTLINSYSIEIMSIINKLIKYNDIEIPTAENSQLIDTICQYIQDHIKDDLHLALISEYFKVSTSTISHLFQRNFGISYYQFVIQRRLAESQKLILSNQSLKIIWYDCGFPDYSSFYRGFKKNYGMSPAQYKDLFNL